MRNRRTAMLGGSGFVGRYVVKRLAARGDVVAVGCRNAEEAKFLRPMGEVGQVQPLNLAISDEAVLSAFLAGNDGLVNCVGILRESGSQTFERVHHTGPALLARLAREAGVERFVHISAIGADPRSSSAYARTKAAGEQAVRDAFPTVTILRPSVVFGPEDQFFNRFAAMATISPVLPLIGGGETRFQPVYVGDVADAVIKCLEDPATAGRTYELGGPKIYTFREVIEMLLREIRRHLLDECTEIDRFERERRLSEFCAREGEKPVDERGDLGLLSSRELAIVARQAHRFPDEYRPYNQGQRAKR